ncbi:MAG: hypothetical protein PHE52_02715 [Candidatus Pacebacteria bacterium]|nr:hypothetical protein [Candidatus Paceibacterota bacterium]
MKKLIFLLFSLTFFPFIASADFGGMMGYGVDWRGMMGGAGMFGMGLAGFLFFVLVSFIFSLIFWLVYKCLIKK